MKDKNKGYVDSQSDKGLTRTQRVYKSVYTSYKFFYVFKRTSLCSRKKVFVDLYPTSFVKENTYL